MHFDKDTLINIPGFFCVKDKDGKYLVLNKTTLNIVGYKNLEQALGKTDFDLPCEASKFTATFKQQDELCIKKEGITTIDFHS